MAKNTSNNPGLETNESLNGSAADDQLTGALGDDIIAGGQGDDILSGDQAVPGVWFFELFDFNFSSAAGQAFDFGDNAADRIGSGYVADFNVAPLTNTVRGTTSNPSDFGIIYTSTINVVTGGTYTFSTTSDDGSTIQLFDSSGTAVTFLNQDGTTDDYMDNDFHQPETTRSGQADLLSGETYTIQIRYWENEGFNSLSATVSGPDTGGVSDDLLTTSMLGPPPTPDFSTTGVPAGVEGNDTIYGGVETTPYQAMVGMTRFMATKRGRSRAPLRTSVTNITRLTAVSTALLLLVLMLSEITVMFPPRRAGVTSWMLMPSVSKMGATAAPMQFGSRPS